MINLEYPGRQMFIDSWMEQCKNNFVYAISLYNQGIDLASENLDVIVPVSDIANAYVNIGICYYEMGDVDQYENYAHLAIEADPQYPNGYYQLGRCMFDIDNYSKAVECFAKVIELKYWNPDGYYMLSQSLYLYLVNDSPFDLNGMLGQIRYLEEMSRAYEGIKQALKMLLEQSTDSDIDEDKLRNYHFLAGRICKSLGEITQAKYHLNIAAKLGDSDAVKILSMI